MNMGLIVIVYNRVASRGQIQAVLAHLHSCGTMEMMKMHAELDDGANEQRGPGCLTFTLATNFHGGHGIRK